MKIAELPKEEVKEEMPEDEVKQSSQGTSEKQGDWFRLIMNAKNHWMRALKGEYWEIMIDKNDIFEFWATDDHKKEDKIIWEEKLSVLKTERE